MTDRSQFWRRHLEAIDAEGISTVAYAERERLSLLSLYQWRQKLKSDFGIAISKDEWSPPSICSEGTDLSGGVFAR